MLIAPADHPAVTKYRELLYSRYFTLPDLSTLTVAEVNEATAAELKPYGIQIEGLGSGNKIAYDKAATENEISIQFGNTNNGTVILGSGCGVRGRILLASDQCLFSASGFFRQGGPSTIDVVINGPAAALFGRNVSSVGSQWIIEGENRCLIVGDDSMISWQVEARNYDSHAVFDLETGTIINEPTDIIVGAHCWLGQKVVISRGISVGNGAILGIASVVTADVPACCAVAGVPARVVRQGVTWDRSWTPSAKRKAELRDYLAT